MRAPKSAAGGRQRRYDRGVRRPRPEVLARLRQLLAASPTISKSELARRAGLSRASVGYYLRHVKVDGAHAIVQSEPIRAPSVTHQQLVERVAHAADDVRLVISELRAEPTTPATSASIFRGYTTAARLWHLLGELLGQIAPPQQNVYLNQVTMLLQQPTAPASLSPTTRAALGLAGEPAPTNQ